MTDRLLLVDYENVQALDVSTIPPDVRVHVVLGAKQKPVVEKVAAKLKPLGSRATVNRIKTLAPNAVDFCIAYYLGEELAQRPGTSCIILSKDKKGFDPLVLHLTKERRRQVRRVNSQKDAFPVTTKKQKTPSTSTKIGNHNNGNAQYGRLVTLLKKEPVRPLKRKSLLGKLKSWFPTLDLQHRESLLQRLFGDGHVREADGAVTYNL